ncbi:GDSL-type esterase/lipase family protein [Streptomyces sp. NBC_01216]|uniref:GDSL-type esterase/lipase family protein n=1 Tax=unclassified Streptomyces TaxID=2593676 RepID=UPI002E15519D|nr:GDSL-type esterase/lipase family protein [Streptomyces sp. NBC_01216]
MRFMFVGDSMTIGRAGDYTWRYRMWQHLDAALPDRYEIVGPRTALYDAVADAPLSHDYRDPAFPAPARRHLAGWGEGWLHMAPVVGETVARTRADVLLVSLGLIDLGFYTSSDQTAENVRAFVGAARAANPRVRAVLLPVIPNVRAESDGPFAAECHRFNELLARTVADLDTVTSPLLLATVPGSYDLRTDTYDGTHPGPTGEHKLAAAFADRLYRSWGIGAAYGSARRAGAADDGAARNAAIPAGTPAGV